jgi:hypothetical protein
VSWAYTSGRDAVSFFAKQDVTVLRSTAANLVDDYSMAKYGWNIETKGGGIQYFTKEPAWEMSP